MSGKGRKVRFHGAFTSKARAVRKERKVGGYIQRKRMRGGIRYVVLTRRSR